MKKKLEKDQIHFSNMLQYYKRVDKDVNVSCLSLNKHAQHYDCLYVIHCMKIVLFTYYTAICFMP